MNHPSKDHSQEVKDYYGKTLQHSEDLKTNACCAIDSYPPKINATLKLIHDEVKDKFYGCGLAIPPSPEGMRILDLGSGSGRDSYILSHLAGEQGFVTGVDMTPEQLEVARRHIDHQTQAFGYKSPNIEFLEGDIQNLSALGLPEASYDLITSNCVINLVNDKQSVFQEAYRVLKEGGELYFSDVYADRRVPTELIDDPVLYGECLSGALYWNDFLKLAKQAGFADPRMLEWRPLTIDNRSIEEKLEGINFYSVTCRLFKFKEMEPDCEDYGQAVRYRGGAEEMERIFTLDSGHQFEQGKIERVCGNSFRMLKDTRFEKYFDFFGDFSQHYGVYPGCGGHFPFQKKDAFQEKNAAKADDSGGCGC